MEDIVGASVRVEEDLETVSGSLELFWDLRRCKGDDLQEFIVVDGWRRRRRWRVHHRFRVNGVVRRVETQVLIRDKQGQITRPAMQHVDEDSE